MYPNWGSAVVLALLQNRLAAHVSYVGAMRVAIAVPVAALLIGSVLCLALQPPRPRAATVASGPPDIIKTDKRVLEAYLGADLEEDADEHAGQ